MLSGALLAAVLAAPASQAADQAGPAPTAGARAAGLPVPPPQPVLPGAPEGAASADYVPHAGVLREIGQRQTELAILELDIRKAELQKKLRDLDAAGPAMAVAPPATALAEGGAAKSAAPSLAAMAPSAGTPMLRRIHKQGHELAAILMFPGGEAREVRRGAFLPGELRVLDVLPDAVLVRRREEAPFSLPVVSGFAGGPP